MNTLQPGRDSEPRRRQRLVQQYSGQAAGHVATSAERPP